MLDTSRLPLHLDSMARARRRAIGDGTRRGPAPGPSGDAGLAGLLHDYLTGGCFLEADRLVATVTAGGRGALRLALDLLRGTHPEATVWLPAPGRDRDAALAVHLGLNIRPYPWSDAAGIATGPMLDRLGATAPGDVILVQACGHDPTGLDLGPGEWSALAQLCRQTGAVPLIDLSQAGPAAGPAAAMEGPAALMAAVPEALLAVSAAQGFGLEEERTGLLYLQAETPEEAGAALLHLQRLTALAIGMPPLAGARAAAHLLASPELRHDWEAEMRRLRMSLGTTRAALAEALAERIGGTDWSPLAGGRGLFACLPLDPAGRLQLWTDHGIATAAGGRVNLSGLDEAMIARLAEALPPCLAATGPAPRGLAAMLACLPDSGDPAGDPPAGTAASGEAPLPREEGTAPESGQSEAEQDAQWRRAAAERRAAEETPASADTQDGPQPAGAEPPP
ncbi:aminotransferase class I/II-fold pyridoxal phosphate-dependent enzyme [Mangrovicoccus algicola]|uniref:Aminotransferase class I/II-fold pyridoxal phosphate-dependent enzyme n=1 Tax=Mangrovicoccus algicola TaxID=2771008 RepID=A0A8J6YWR7_9RHOB|nr:aminotransferase class I/II-fold pyridoxal phosphate-dependent enzyme [Mangrovicoccus algicola]